MNYDDPNRPQSGANAREEKRDLEHPASGNAARDGYTTIARRPNVPFDMGTVPADEADRIEAMYREFPF